MSEISKAYEPQSVEDKWYRFWLDRKCFVADPARVSSKRPAYAIVIPPPNVTGVLTMGHVLNNTIQDLLARKARMDGKEVLWLPGTDHAGIATQTVVEKALKKSGEIRHRDDLGREKFLERVWQWKEKHGGIIIQQLKKLGASCDWTRERFTMDPDYSRCVQKVFVELYKKGLIYRGKRMVNWCPATQTALSDEEVIMKEQKGSLYYFKVEVVDSRAHGSSGRESAQTPAVENQSRLTSAATEETEKKTFGPITDAEGRIWLTIATTRPETIPGDTAVAVNPKDPRYAKFIGKHVIRPLPAEFPREQKLIPIIGDERVDFEFGTGVLKVTPAHDKADFEIGQRHKLEQIDIMHPNGHMNALAGAALNGLDRFKARKVAVELLTELGALEKEDPYTNNVGFSERADVPIEPRLSEQWFLKYPCTEKARNCVEQEDDAVGRASSRAGSSVASPHQKMQFHPQRWAKVYDHWMGNIQDWCISRQLWWGHRIPVWTFKVSSDIGVVAMDAIKESVAKIEKANYPGKYSLTTKMQGDIFVVATDDPEIQASSEKLGFIQDPDVLDTWFSSWLWPFATMGWTGDKTEDPNNPTLQAFYPTADLVTGPDIIFFWVARMIMAGYEFMNDLPFRNVYFTGIIRDKQGRKMSKSLGNSPDPLDLIGKYGADALRFGTMRSAPLGQDILFDEQNVELGRNFCNKLWNACRFRQMVGGGDASSPNRASGDEGVATTFEVQGEIDPKLLTSDDKWILLKLDQAIREMDTAFAEYKFSDATATLYRFFWSEYCDWYVEASKAVLVKSVTELNKSNEQGPTEGNATHLTNRSFNELPDRRANALAVIDFVLSHTLRLFHPFLPFITEELWHGMGYSQDMPENQGGKTIMTAPWPKPFDDDFKSHYGLTGDDDKHIEARNELVSQGRNLRRTANIAANKKVKFIFNPAREWAAHDIEVLKLLLNAECVELGAAHQPAKGTLTVRTELGDLYLPTEGLIDLEAEKARLTKEFQKIEADVAKVEQKLANPNFTQKVPANVLEEHKQRLTDLLAKREHVKITLAALQS
ncbi:MAG TPA: valine--tRNA ligase [Verrucomicrobiae bacterium]|nr:valine--tRNA ligase [Verrucomicrobiae bacterium]